MSDELVVFDATGTEVDWCDPYVSHRVEDGVLYVDNSLDEHRMEIPEGGRYEIRPMGVPR